MLSESKTTVMEQRVADLLGALISGLVSSIVLGWSRSSGEVFTNDFFNSVLIGTSCYVIAALILMGKNAYWKIPRWFVIPILGSVLSFVNIVLLPNVVSTWNLRVEPESTTVLGESSTNLFISLVADSFITMPIMAIFHYLLPSAIQLIRRRAEHDYLD